MASLVNKIGIVTRGGTGIGRASRTEPSLWNTARMCLSNITPRLGAGYLSFDYEGYSGNTGGGGPVFAGKVGDSEKRLRPLLYIPSAGMKKASPDFSETALQLHVLWSG
jgi:hypothetical protein